MSHIYCKSIHAATPAGMSLKATFNAVLNGENRQMQLRPAEDFQVAEPVMASLFDRDELIPMLLEATADMQPDATLFERLCVWSAREALKATDVDPAAATTLLIISTTKGNVELLNDNIADHRAPLCYSAEVIAKALGCHNEPITVSNACVSGVAALATACSLLTGTDFTDAIVVGCDLINRFIISGFQSFKALSKGHCRPYDSDRCGLNLGEAVATFILSEA
ncbi:MAG: 3-oxoacyl-ACP synthase, partial [Muribaculaceae bacterium]|nr:3-oxoacyl-ACP synthase [Muribaculaceae bacterium]